jgi:flavin-dependent dehydrogenase
MPEGETMSKASTTNTHDWDLVIVGGGPTGTTVASLVLKYSPDTRILILEKDLFPREHIGESQLPAVSTVLHEMGVWDEVEAANFPIKLGATFSWGKDAEEWDLDFYPAEEFVDEPRPAKYEGQRRFTAFQVERDRYDQILLDHAIKMGTTVRQETMVREVLKDGDTITGLTLDNGETITATQYIDASGATAFIRRAMGVESVAPTQLRNVAFWDYYDDAKWAVEIGVGGTRINIRSLAYGWIWFIPLGPSRASVGLVCPADYYKTTGLTVAEAFHKAIDDQPFVKNLLKDASSSTGGKVHSIKDWSHLADRLVGENWWICGEAGGFADPILSAGLTLAHGTAREVAYSILEMQRGDLDTAWLKHRYNDKARRNINQHIRFAEYWYATNGCFTDLQEHCRAIAKDAGLRMAPRDAWRWLAQGGFVNEDPRRAGFGSFDLSTGKQLVEKFHGRSLGFEITKFNEYTVNLRGAKEDRLGYLEDGRIVPIPCYRRGESTLPMTGYYKQLLDVLAVHKDIKSIYTTLEALAKQNLHAGAVQSTLASLMGTLEAMLSDGWVTGKLNKKKQVIQIASGGGRQLRSAQDGRKAMAEKGKASFHFADADETQE